MAMIELKDITFSRGNKKVLENLDLEIADKKFTCLLGATGSGKTTLLRLIAGLETPDSGKILIGGKLATNGHTILIEPSKRKVGFVFQDLALWPHFTVFKNVEWSLRIQNDKEAASKADRIIDNMGLTEHKKKYPHQLSGGQQQQLAMARALATQPEILLMDEPLSGLDANLKEQMMEYIIKVKNEFNITIIQVTHDHNEALRLADTIVVLNNNGKIEASGTPEEMSKSSNEFVRKFLRIK